MNGVFARWVSLLWGLVLLTSSCLSQATTYQDWWNNPSLSGMGLNVGQQGENIFVSWYLYDETQSPSFLLLYGDLQDNKILSAPLRRYYGPEPPAYDESQWYGEIVGSATITFTSPTTGTFSYQYGDNVGSFEIQRYAFNPVDLTGLYSGAQSIRVSNCGSADGDYSYVNTNFAVTHVGDDFTLENVSEGCIYEGTIKQYGSHFKGSGSLSCADGATGTWSSPDIVSGEFALQLYYSLSLSNAGSLADGCQVAGRLGGAEVLE